MYIPIAALASESLDVAPYGRLLRFNVYSLALHRPCDDPYNEVVRELEKEGSHRNVFLVDGAGVPMWRIADYVQHPRLPDAFIALEASKKSDTALGWTFHGHIFEIALLDGSLTKIGWTK